MILLGVAIGLWLGGAAGAVLVRRRAFAGPLGAGAAVAGGVAASASAIGVLTSGMVELWRVPWRLPAGALALRVDALAAIFLLPIAAVGALCAVYGVGYLRRHARDEGEGGSFAAYNVLLASMAVVVTANDLVLLLLAWELMTLSSWRLVVSDHEEGGVRAAGLQYLVASHLAAAALFLLVLLMAAGSGTFELVATPAGAALPSGLLFMLALVGFGTKAGIVPLHVWLPDAHPAAPSHVSAVMSAVMVTMGFYGLARFLPLFGEPAIWWGYVLLVLGAAGAIGGILFAIAQRDVKRILAYSTIENAGIATLALGLGVLGTALRQPLLAAFGWMAALLHLWNHALAKAGLFLGFGAVAQAAESRSLDALGGFAARWPVWGSALVVVAAAIAALPGLNVFTSEYLLLRGLLLGGATLRGVPQVALLGAVVALSFTGGLAVACFTRLVGVGLLGTPRSAHAAAAPRPTRAMHLAVLAFVAGCLLVAAFPVRVAGAVGEAVRVAAPGVEPSVAAAALGPLAVLGPLLAAAAAAFLALRGIAGRRSATARGGTWGCGYDAPSPAMQYTSTSFGEPLTRVLQPVLATRTESEMVAGAAPAPLWPEAARWRSRTPDRALAGMYLPLFAAVGRGAARLRAHYRAGVTTSLLYVAVAIVALLLLLFLPGGGV
ncbi:MAG TPA: proton-conducting transporter membrane subunit [Longimicrobiales bacterium]|nr:proton-conducting transporter membrane subunit [Longimicrobiales bacterium]